MEKRKRVRLLPFDYLQKIGRYSPLVHNAKNALPYPDEMIKELKRNANKVFEITEIDYPFRQKDYLNGKSKQFLSLWITPVRGWIIPRNWTIAVKASNSRIVKV